MVFATDRDELCASHNRCTQSSLFQALAAQLLEVNTPEIVKYSKTAMSNAGTLAEVLIANGHKLASGGTANHLVLWDLRPQGLTKSNVEKVFYVCLVDDACTSYDFVSVSQANSCSFYSEATLLQTVQRKTATGTTAPL